jgi:hypothetical protein
MQLIDIAPLDAAGAPLATQFSDEHIRQVVFNMLKANTLCSIATVTPDGRARQHRILLLLGRT